jgi:response regulator RpfG family c-di-GMP phosphodiesterase
MDISMPIMDGYEAIDAIRANSKYDNIPIVALTSLALDSDIDKIFFKGANAYIGKPLKMGYLYTVCKLFLNPKVDTPKPIEEKENDEVGVVDVSGALNIVRGIQHASGSEALYNEVLDEFISAYGNSDETLQRMVDENRLEQVKRLCLDMKGLTGAIGAEKMFDIVDAMHKQFLYNNVHLIPKFVETYHNGLTELNLAIKKYRAES